MLGLGLGGFEGAGEDTDLGVLDLLGHLGVTDVLVDDCVGRVSEAGER